MPRTITIARLAVLLCAAASASAMAQGGEVLVPSFKELDSMEARVQGCVTCHGKDGQGNPNGSAPRIAGKPAGYLYNQLAYFRNGTRRYPPMNYLLAYLPDSYLQEMANYFSSRRPPFATPTPSDVGAEVLARGQAVVRNGDTSQGVPACIACHGERLTGMNPGIPGLAGLNRTYIAAQLTRWRVGERNAADPDCMKRIASRLSDSDIKAVSAWLGEQKPPADPEPESSNLVRMPLACGSER